jgi:hypothetical protein
MKSIALLTMLFLPATFVAVCSLAVDPSYDKLSQTSNVFSSIDGVFHGFLRLGSYERGSSVDIATCVGICTRSRWAHFANPGHLV